MPFDVHRVDPLSAWLAGGAGPIWGCYARCLVVQRSQQCRQNLDRIQGVLDEQLVQR